PREVRGGGPPRHTTRAIQIAHSAFYPRTATQEDTMSTKTDEVTSGAIKRAIEGRDGSTLASFYADDAVLRIVDRNNPPSRPREVKGRSAINTFWDDICSRAMTHKVDVSITEGDRLAFTQACAYPD